MQCTLLFCEFVRARLMYNLATYKSLFSIWRICLRETKTRIRLRDWLKLVSAKIRGEQVGTFLLFSVRANKFAKWKRGFKAHTDLTRFGNVTQIFGFLSSFNFNIFYLTKFLFFRGFVHFRKLKNRVALCNRVRSVWAFDSVFSHFSQLVFN